MTDNTPKNDEPFAEASMLAELALPVDAVQRILGHVHPASTQVYVHAYQSAVTDSVVEAWRRGRTRPRSDLAGPDDETVLNTPGEVLND